MSSTFLGLNTAYTGPQASQAALNTTANNVSNAETKGYSRQVVSTQAADAIRSFTTYGCVGAGVEFLLARKDRSTCSIKSTSEREEHLEEGLDDLGARNREPKALFNDGCVMQSPIEVGDDSRSPW